MTENAQYCEWFKRRFGDDEPVLTEALRGNSHLTEGIWRISGYRRSVVVKIISSAREIDGDPWAGHWGHDCGNGRHWNYWKREYLAYSEGVTAMFGQAGIFAPDLLDVLADGERIAMFFEDCRLVPATLWGPDDYCCAARDLGFAQGRLLETSGISTPAWFCRNFVADYALEKPFERSLVTVDEAWAELIDTGVVTSEERDRQVKFALSERYLLSILEEVPETICHNDFWTNNLFGDSGQLTTVVDWAFIGRGAIGSDIANMVASAGFDGFVSGADLLAFGERVFLAYLNGLRDAGWTGDERLARLGYLASSVKYAWVVAAMLSSMATARHPIYVGYGHDGQLDFRAVAATLNMLAGWCELASQIYAGG